MSNNSHILRRIKVFIKYIFMILLLLLYFILLFRESRHGIRRSNIALQSQRNKLKLQRYSLKIHNYVTPVIKKLEQFKKTKSTTLNPIYEYSEELQIEIERELNERKKHLWKTCIMKNLTGLYPPKPKEFFLSPGHNLVWCNVFKAASSTWMYYFNILGGYNIKYLQKTKTLPLELARKRFPRPNQSELVEAIYNSISFFIIREPFERLLSAYKDKLEGGKNQYYKVLGYNIVKNLRNNTNKEKLNMGPTFKEFLLYLIETNKNGEKFDEHWAPIYSFCTPCSINYSVIASIDTFERDTQYIIRHAGLESLLLDKIPHNKMGMITNRSPVNTKNLIEEYFSSIDYKTFEEISKIYLLDFELFGYNISKYKEIVQTAFIN